MTIEEIQTLTSSRKDFDAYLYTPIDKAIEELLKRRSDELCQKKIEPLFSNSNNPLESFNRVIPAVLFRQLSTPNYETRRFMQIAETYGLEPIFWEYYNDKFISNNALKHSLGKMIFFEGDFGKDGRPLILKKNIIDFNIANGKVFNDISTLWGQSFIDFHHELMQLFAPKISFKNFIDASKWLHEQGNLAKDYYEKFLTLFVKDAILFENFMLNEEEKSLTENVVLPAFASVFEKTGYKPLIVALDPTNIEESDFWLAHPKETKDVIDKKLEESL